VIFVVNMSGVLRWVWIFPKDYDNNFSFLH